MSHILFSHRIIKFFLSFILFSPMILFFDRFDFELYFENSIIILNYYTMFYLYVESQAILAEGAKAPPVTLSGGVLFASWKLIQFPSMRPQGRNRNFSRASAQNNSFEKNSCMTSADRGCTMKINYQLPNWKTHP